MGDGAALPLRGAFRAKVARWLPPARVTWLVLAALAGYEVDYFRGMGLVSIVGLPLLAVAVDLTFQRVRFEHLRVPDAAIATGAFIALLLPPSVPIVWAGTAAVVAIAAKHVLRRGGRPWVNPAAFGTLVGIALFGLAPAWWVTVNLPSEILMVAGGAILIARNPVNWRLPATFFVVYAALWAVTRVPLLVGASLQVLLLGLFDPVMLFFGLYMVSEPRSAPRRPSDQFPYAAIVALSGVMFNYVLPNEGPLVGLTAVGIAWGVGAWVYDARFAARAEPAATGAAGRAHRGNRRPRPGRAAPPPARWGIGRRVAASLLIVVILVGVYALAPPTGPSGTALRGLPPGGTGGAGTTPPQTLDCAADNPAIPSSSLSSLHQVLGPSVILSYNPSTGVTVFYDPANHLTVTETDLYEDYGYAEFNGDDYAVPGCHP